MGGKDVTKKLSANIEKLRKQLATLNRKKSSSGNKRRNGGLDGGLSSEDDEDDDTEIEESTTRTRSGGGKTTTYVRVLSKKSGGDWDSDDDSSSPSDDSSASSGSDDDDDVNDDERYGGGRNGGDRDSTKQRVKSESVSHHRRKHRRIRHTSTTSTKPKSSSSEHGRTKGGDVMMYGGGVKLGGGGNSNGNGVTDTSYVKHLREKLASYETRVQTLESRLAKIQGFTKKRMAGETDFSKLVRCNNRLADLLTELESVKEENTLLKSQLQSRGGGSGDGGELRSGGAGSKKKKSSKKRTKVRLPALERFSDSGWNYKLSFSAKKRRSVLRKIVNAWGALKVFRHLNQLGVYNKNRPKNHKIVIGDRNWVKKTFYNTKRWGGKCDYTHKGGDDDAVSRSELIGSPRSPQAGQRYYGRTLYGTSRWWTWNASTKQWLPVRGVMGHSSSYGGGETEPLRGLVGADGFIYTARPDPGTQFYGRPVNESNYESNYDTYTWDGRMWVNLSHGNRYGGGSKNGGAKKKAQKLRGGSYPGVCGNYFNGKRFCGWYEENREYQPGDMVQWRVGQFYVALDDIAAPAPGRKNTPPPTSSRWKRTSYSGYIGYAEGGGATKTTTKKKKKGVKKPLKAKTIYSRLKPADLKKGYKLNKRTGRPVKKSTGKVARLVKAVKKSVYKRLFLRRRRQAGETDRKTKNNTTITTTKQKQKKKPKSAGKAKHATTPQNKLVIPASLKRVLRLHHITPQKKIKGGRGTAAKEYSDTRSYDEGTIVRYRGKKYRALDDISRAAPGRKHTPPSTSSRWKLIQ